MKNWTPAWIVIFMLAATISTILIVPLFRPEGLSDEGVDLYELALGGALSMLANALGRYQGRNDN